MLLQQLAADADRIVGELPPPMYDRKPVKWIIELDMSGEFLGIVLQTGDGGPKDKGKLMLVPYVKRTSGLRPLLLADTVTYVLGMAPQDRRVEEKHAAFLELAERCASTTGVPEVAAVVELLKRLRQEWEIDAEVAPDDVVSFRVDGTHVVDIAAVRAFWANEVTGSEGEDFSGHARQCLVCDERAPIPSKVPVPVKGIPGGQSAGTALVAVNSKAFESYGLDRATTSGVCQSCGERFGKALNALLKSEANRLRVGPTVFVFWTQKDVGFDFVTHLSKPDVDQVRSLLSSHRSGVTSAAVDDSAFYATALSANSARAVVRDWLSTTVATAKRNLCRWFELTRQVDAWGKEGAPVGVYRLAAAPYRDASKQMHPALPGLLVRAALHGERMPAGIISAVLLRLRAESNVTYEQAVLLKVALLSINPGKESYMSSLETEETSVAYSCGRALAVLEAIQRRALGKVNSTIVDKYFAAASSTPASVFGRLLSGAQPHLAKMRKSEQTKGAAVALERRLEEVLAPIDAFPTTLSLRDQALFALGYYHQRAADRAASSSKSAGETAGNHDYKETEE